MATTNPFKTPITIPKISTPNISGSINTTTANSTPSMLGISAKAPEQNIPKPQGTIPSSMQKTTTTATPTAPKTSGVLPTAIKVASTSPTNKATLYGPNGQKQVVDIGSSQASQLQSQGWGLTAGSYKAPVTPKTSSTASSSTSNIPATTTSGTKLYTNPDGTVSPVNPAAPPDTSYKGLIQNQVQTAQQGNPTAQSAATGLLDLSGVNPATSGPAYQKYQDTIAKVNDLDQQYAKAKAELSSSPISLEFKQGREQVLDNEYQQQRQALTNEMNAYATANQQNITGVQTQQSGYGTAGTLGTTQQGLLQSALATAAGQAAPIQVPYGIPLVSPQTGTQIGGTGGGVQPSDPFYATMQQYAQLLASNQGSALPASITSNPVLNAQVIQMAKAINPNFNVNVAAGAGQAQAGVAGSQYGEIQSYQSALQKGQNLKAQFNDLLNSLGLNPSDVNKVNEGLQVIARNTSDPRYQILSNYVNDIANTYAQILTPAGGSQTNQTRDIATSMLDSSMKGTGLQTVMDSLDAAAQAKIAGVGTSGGIGTGGSINSGNTVSAGGFNYVQDANGNWVVKR